MLVNEINHRIILIKLYKAKHFSILDLSIRQCLWHQNQVDSLRGKLQEFFQLKRCFFMIETHLRQRSDANHIVQVRNHILIQVELLIEVFFVEVRRFSGKWVKDQLISLFVNLHTRNPLTTFFRRKLQVFVWLSSII